MQGFLQIAAGRSQVPSKKLGPRNVRVCGLVVVAAGLLVVTPSPTPSAVLCAGKRGAVFLRDACRRKETALSLDPTSQRPQNDRGPAGETGPAGPPGAPGATGPAGVNASPPLRIVDAHGADVGTVLRLEGDSCDPGTVAMREIDAAWFRFHVGKTGFLGSPRTFHYDDATCAGARYFRLDDADTPLPGFASCLSIDATLVGHYALDADGADRPLWRRRQVLDSCDKPGTVFPAEPSLLPPRCSTSTSLPPNLCQFSECVPVGVHPAAPVRTVDLKSLGLLSPFRVDR